VAEISPVVLHANMARPITHVKPIQKHIIKTAPSPISLAQLGKTIITHAGFRGMEQRTTQRTTRGGRSEHVSSETKAEEEQEAQKILEVEAATEFMDQEKNPELDEEALRRLMEKLSASDTKESALAKVGEEFADFYLAHEALEALMETADPDLVEILKAARDDLNAKHEMYITAGKNIGTEPYNAAPQVNQTPSALRALYHDIIANPRSPIDLFQELSKLFEFKYLDPLISYLLHSIGKDLKSDGPSISREKLHVLFSECRSLQAIRVVYEFFLRSMPAIAKEFGRNELNLPDAIKFDSLAKQYVTFLAIRYPAMDKVFAMAPFLGIQDSLEAKLIVFNWFRIATYETSPKLFGNLKRREEIRKALRDAIKKIDDELEEELASGE
jgi:type III secretion system YopN/LcrE/InvE/MxiC family regulator